MLHLRNTNKSINNMNETKRKNYVKPHINGISVDTESMLLADSDKPAATNAVSVEDWQEDATTDMGSATVDPWADGDLW